MTTRTRPRLDLDPATVRQARSLARKAGRPIVKLARQHTTVSVERATLRLAGLSGADPDGTPWVNRLLDAVRGDVGLEHGAALPVWDAHCGRYDGLDLGELRPSEPPPGQARPGSSLPGRDAVARRGGRAQAGGRRASARDRRTTP